MKIIKDHFIWQNNEFFLCTEFYISFSDFKECIKGSPLTIKIYESLKFK